MTEYIPRDYWLKRGRLYRQQFKHDKKRKLQEKMLIDYLRSLSPFRTVLEVGCGFGRFTKLVLKNFPQIQEYTAIDLSPDQIEEANRYVGNNINRSILKFMVSEIQSLNFGKKYDLVFSVSVLLHILPSEIESVINKLIGMTGQHMVHVDWHEIPISKVTGNYNFMHEYEKIYAKNPNVREVKRIPIIKKGLFGFDTKQSIFHATV